MSSLPWLTLLIAVPLVGAVVTAALAGRGGALAKQVGLGFAVLTLVLGAVVAERYEVGNGGLQLSETHEWIGAFGVNYALGVDGLGLLMVLLTVVLVPIVLVAAWHDADLPGTGRSGTFFAWALALESLSLAVFAATDVFLFYVVFEATLIPAYFLIGGFGRADNQGRRAAAALKFLMFQLGGGLILLGSVIGLYVVSAQQGEASYLLTDLQEIDMPVEAGRWLFAGFFLAFAVKAPLFPLHTWLADTTENATPPTSVLLVCVLDKIGTFGMLRFCLGLFPEASQWATPLVIALALISIVYGAFLAIGQDDLLRLIGLTSLSHFGFITLGIFVFSSQGASGAILYMVNHGIATAALFLAAGFLIRRRGTARISRMGGLEQPMPVLAGLFLVAGLATLGLPGLSQFVSEILVLIAAFDYAWYVGAIAVTGIVLAAVYVLWAYQRMMTGPALVDGARAAGAAGAGAHGGGSHRSSHEAVGATAVRGSTGSSSAGATAAGATAVGTAASGSGAGGATAVGAAGAAGAARSLRDLGAREIGVLAPLTLALVLFGFFPMPLLDVSNPTVDNLLTHVGVSDDEPTVPPGSVEHAEAEEGDN